jgi:hypothetical protein
LPTPCLRASGPSAAVALLGAITMVEISNVLGVLAAVLLLGAVIAWVSFIRGPLMQLTDGRTGMDSAQCELASELLFWAAGLSSTAALLAVAGWIFE